MGKSEISGQTYFKVIPNLNVWYFHINQVTRSLRSIGIENIPRILM